MAAPVSELSGSLFNLIIYTDSPQRSEYFHEIIDALIKKFPSRVIFIESDEAFSKDSPEISKIGGSGKCDQLHIRVSNATLNQLPYLLQPIFVPDLPVYLIWGKNPTIKDPILSELLKLTTRIIYDSQCCDNLKQFSAQILNNLKIENVDFMDIDWALIRGWREVIGKIFDSPEKMDILTRCNSLKIYYNEIPSVFLKHFSTRAFYLQGWLAAQLEWKFLSIDQSRTLSYQSDTSKITVELITDNKPLIPPGTILKIVFHTDLNEEIVISKLEDQMMVMVHITEGDKCELPFSYRLPNFQRGLSFIKEIFYYRSTNHYKHMLQTIQNIDWKP
jgi:glucose-6-phosphate dehydrogenase assembly protein OpcA